MVRHELEDAHLLGRIAGGDSQAFTRLFDRHGTVVLGLLLRILRSRSEAEEMLQEVFLQVWRDAASYRPEAASAKGWILMIARSRAIDLVRSREARRRREEAVGTDPARPVAVAPAGPERIEESERRRQVAAALAVLPEEQRAALECSFFEGLTHREIAERLNAPLGTIKSRILLGMKKLRESLEGLQGMA